jgi:hypothetical protein
MQQEHKVLGWCRGSFFAMTKKVNLRLSRSCHTYIHDSSATKTDHDRNIYTVFHHKIMSRMSYDRPRAAPTSEWSCRTRTSIFLEGPRTSIFPRTFPRCSNELTSICSISYSRHLVHTHVPIQPRRPTQKSTRKDTFKGCRLLKKVQERTPLRPC